MPSLPPDCVLLPISSGALLVSPSHATFCAVPREQVARVRGVISGGREISGGQNETSLNHTLLDRLDKHGFFAGPRPAPRHPPRVRLQLTNACNLHCEYCCTDSGDPRVRELSLQQWKRVVLDALHAYGAEVGFALLGGEPLLSPFALDLAEYILELAAGLTLYTNGILLAHPPTAARVATLVHRGAVLRVSLAGATRGSCDARSGAARFDSVLKGIRNLAANGAWAHLDLMLFPSNVEEMATSLAELRQQLPPKTRLALGLAFLGGRETGAHVFGSRSALESALDRIALETGEAIAAPVRAPLTERREACSCAMGHSLSVRSDGRIFACFRMEEPTGDLRDQSLADTAAWLRANPRPATAFEPCADCPLHSLCGGGCRSDNLLFNGHPERPLCGPWRIQVLSELLAEQRVSCLEWPTAHLVSEAVARNIPCPDLAPQASVQEARVQGSA